MRLMAGLAFIAVISLTVLAFGGLFSVGENDFDWSVLKDAYFHQIVIFSISQAFISALLSVVLAWPVARALYYVPQLPLHRGFLPLCLLCFVMPTLVLITGLVALIGRSGYLSPLISEWFFGEWNLYGISGILIAHLFLNMPLAIRVFYIQLQGIPDSSWRLSLQLKMSIWQRLRWLEWPMLRASALMLFGFIFILCFNSFAIVLALGGGPQSTTLEVAIYQALKYDFNIPEALVFAWTQLVIAGGIFLFVSYLGSPVWLSSSTSSSHWTPVARGWRKTGFAISYWLALGFLVLPILAIFPGIFDVRWHKIELTTFVMPMITTLVLGLVSACLGMLLSYFLLLPVRQAAQYSSQYVRAVIEWIATHALMVPTMVISVGVFVFLLPRLDIDYWGILLVALVNAAIIVPFGVQKLKPRLLLFDQQYGLLVRSLKLRGITCWKIEWPFIRPVFKSTFALVLVLAMGDVAIFSIFGSSEWTTLPWLIYGFAGSYQLAEASLASIILLALCAVVLLLVESNSAVNNIAPEKFTVINPQQTFGDRIEDV